MDDKYEEVVSSLNESPKTIISSDKYVGKFVVEKAIGGFIFYQVHLTKGAMPPQLKGNYTSMKSAVDSVREFLRTAKDTRQATQKYFREKSAKRREKENS